MKADQSIAMQALIAYSNLILDRLDCSIIKSQVPSLSASSPPYSYRSQPPPSASVPPLHALPSPTRRHQATNRISKHPEATQRSTLPSCRNQPGRPTAHGARQPAPAGRERLGGIRGCWRHGARRHRSGLVGACSALLLLTRSGLIWPKPVAVFA